MRRSLTILLLLATANLSTACIASRKFVRNEVKTTADTLNTRIDATNTEVAEVSDGVDRVNQRVTGVDERVTGVDGKVTTVDGKVTALDSRTTVRFDSLTGEMKVVDQKATEAGGAVAALDQRFQQRNLFAVADEKTVLFKFNSAQLDTQYQTALDEVAETMTQNPDAMVVMEGRTDATGDKEYNIRLADRRVESVKRYLAVEKGVPIYRIHHISFGAAKPIAANDSREGREKNRAVTMMILIPRSGSATTSRNNN
jgi:outer membrane protein OmpA-like peptidoglycan-associated protein